MKDLRDVFLNYKGIVDQEINKQLPPASSDPVILHQAMRYSVLSNGKRLRPILLLETCRALGGNIEDALPAAAAIECVHSFSLIHDDLPMMDDDDLRRGIPTCHKMYGEAIALLAGDALLGQAFTILTAPPNQKWGATAARLLVFELAQAVGSQGLCGGQTVDILAERGILKHDAQHLNMIHERKTGALLVAAMRMGAILADVSPEHLELISQAAFNLGLAFQIKDDILDILGDSRKLGKNTKRDLELGKLTYPALYGLAQSQQICADLSDNALANIEFLGKEGDRLRQIFTFIVARDY